MKGARASSRKFEVSGVTDFRDRRSMASHRMTDDEALVRLAAAGRIRLPDPGADGGAPGPIEGFPGEVDVQVVLAEVRADRFQDWNPRSGSTRKEP